MSLLGNEVAMSTANNYVTDAQLSALRWRPIEPTHGGVVFAKVGAALLLDRKRLVDAPFLIDNNMMAYLFDSSWDRYFAKTLFDALRLAAFAQVGALPSFNASDIEDGDVVVPGDHEQARIGEFFRVLDALLAANQRKADLLVRLKRAHLQRLFPQATADRPRLRFRGFSGSWTQRKLGEVADIVRGASPRPIQDPKWFDDTSEIGWLRIADVTEQDGRIHRLEQHLSRAGQLRTRVLMLPHLLLSIAATVGKPVVNYIPTGVHDGFLIFLNPKFELEFMFRWLEHYREDWQRCGQPGSQVNLNSELVQNQEVALPASAEQGRIGEFFSVLDALLAANQRRIAHLRTLKRAYLQQMFV